MYWDITRSVKERFDAAGISIPYPQRDVHVYQVANDPKPAPRRDQDEPRGSDEQRAGRPEGMARFESPDDPEEPHRSEEG